MQVEKVTKVDLIHFMVVAVEVQVHKMVLLLLTTQVQVEVVVEELTNLIN